MMSSREGRHTTAYRSPGYRSPGQEGQCQGSGLSWSASTASLPTCTVNPTVTDAAAESTPAPAPNLQPPAAAASTASRSSWRARCATAYSSPGAGHTPAPLPDSRRCDARLASAYTSPDASAPVRTPLPAVFHAASPPPQPAFSPSARSFTSPADPLNRAIELGQLEEMAKSPPLTLDQLQGCSKEESERAIADELVVLAAMDPESLAFSNGTNAGRRSPPHPH